MLCFLKQSFPNLLN